MELRRYADGRLGLSLDEATGPDDVAALLEVFTGQEAQAGALVEALEQQEPGGGYGGALARGEDDTYMTHPVFHSYHAEHEMLRYLHRLQARDLSMTTSMIPLGSCTMKLNAAAEMLPITLPGFAEVHPFSPPERNQGYLELIEQLEGWLAEITGLPAVSLQPNAGSQGEYAGLLCIRAYHQSRDEAGRDVCLIPSSAHGTNPASAVMAGMKVVVVACDEQGNVDLDDLRKKAEKHAEKLAGLMVTYPSTHGVFEEGIREICEIVHQRGGLVYMDGANMNAQVGLCRPGDFGVDVCHLNLHKTFTIPHGGGGPGMGPICVSRELAPYLPGHSVVEGVGGERSLGQVAAAPWGSPGILPISWMYIGMMGGQALTRASQVAILNANYLARRLGEHYPLLYSGAQGTVAHEFILDLRPLQESAGVSVADVAKRLMDYGFHAPTMSWPVPGTLMIEPTESESKAELDRFAEAMIAIRQEIRDIEEGRLPREDNPLVNAPHTPEAIAADSWDHPYSRQQAAFPAPWTQVHKYWPPVARVDDAYGDRNLQCTCTPIAAYEDGTGEDEAAE